MIFTIIDLVQFFWLPILGFVILVILLTNRYKNNETPAEKKAKANLASLNKQIAEAKEKLQGIEMNNSVQLTNSQNDALEVYERSGIKIQSDILEGVVHMGLTDKDEIHRYIENERLNWVRENQKKVYK